MAVLGPNGGHSTPVLLHPLQFRSYPWFLAKITQISDFLRSQILEKWQIWGFHRTSKSQKCFSFCSASASGLRCGLRLQTPLQARATALAMASGNPPDASSSCCMPTIIKIGQCFLGAIQKIKVVRLGTTVYIYGCYYCCSLTKQVWSLNFGNTASGYRKATSVLPSLLDFEQTRPTYYERHRR